MLLFPACISSAGVSMSTREIVYFDSPGKRNTDAVLDAVAKRVKEGGIKHIVVASSKGQTAAKVLSKFRAARLDVVVVTSHSGFEKEGEIEMAPQVERDLLSKGARIVRASHVLSGLERSMTRKFGGASRVEAIAEALRALFGQGMKVCVEVTVMAADAGAIPCGETEIIVIAGTGWGADTACVVRPAHANDFFKFEVREVLAMPRIRHPRRRK
jgi:hypothetical protein